MSARQSPLLGIPSLFPYRQAQSDERRALSEAIATVQAYAKPNVDDVRKAAEAVYSMAMSLPSELHNLATLEDRCESLLLAVDSCVLPTEDEAFEAMRDRMDDQREDRA
jgi:hypothetical protein